jgi:hypothetical protein
MLRFLGVIFLSLCVLAMPSYAAIACGSACTTETNTHEHACCPDELATARPASAHDDGPTDSSHSGTGGRHHCAAPCCGYVATVLSASAVHVDSQPLADLIPTAAALVGSVDHESIFHPPRL